ncbi:MAG: indolepyruvate oxidoreductase subunit beta [Chloroflexota bacterium]
MKEINFLVVGVGGQGALLASNVLAEVGLRAGFDVKKAEVHGMSQRGGSVNSHVRWGADVKSPVIGRGEVDVLLSLEKLEALRYLAMLRKDGTALIGESKIPPLTVSSGDDSYPDDDEISRAFSQVTDDFYFIPTLTLAEQAGTARAHNVVLLGALSAQIGGVSPDVWLEVIEERVPKKYIELNRKAFEAGRRAGLSQV